MQKKVKKLICRVFRHKNLFIKFYDNAFDMNRHYILSCERCGDLSNLTIANHELINLENKFNIPFSQRVSNYIQYKVEKWLEKEKTTHNLKII